MPTIKMLHLQLSLTAKTFMKDNVDMTAIELLSCYCRDCWSSHTATWRADHLAAAKSQMRKHVAGLLFAVQLGQR